ncbi:AsnC family transcriptional regulator [Glutamicibacter uratoxydans]|uniref:AsnC family transcriptional regulator n=1 Tax=Glutamicibacter uratoxydans TaxID=43667 RepID=A0A4Y4DQA0_GLUUR|nr:AsnC family transcriptional regulator [Glutamicibacter uratoxydans]GED07106.1 AsnC family transcriptional regulator [Glutamicibacter uratoxydans]
MPKYSIGSELDLAIVGALEVQPRVEFTKLAQILGVSSSTVARRWDLMQSEGVAWTTVIPGARFLETGWSAFIAIECEPGQEDELAKALCAEPAFGTVALITHHRQFHVDYFAASHHAGMDALQTIFRRLPGVRSRHISPISKIYRQANEWSSGTLAAVDKQKFNESETAEIGYFQPDGLDTAIVELLFIDARQSWQHLANLLDVSAQTIQRRVHRLVASGLVAFRCDSGELTSRGLKDFNISWSVPPIDVDQVGQALANDSACRVSARTIDSSNLAATFWLRDLNASHVHEITVQKLSPQSYVQDRFIALKTLKRGGQILDDAGRRVKGLAIPLV